MKFDCDQVFNGYHEVKSITHCDIFHLYDTGKECLKDNSGYHDSRHFILWGYNTITMQKCNLGVHDGIMNFSADNVIFLMRVYADGSFFISFKEPVRVQVSQCVELYRKLF